MRRWKAAVYLYEQHDAGHSSELEFSSTNCEEVRTILACWCPLEVSSSMHSTTERCGILTHRVANST